MSELEQSSDAGWVGTACYQGTF